MMYGLGTFLILHVLTCVGPLALGSDIINGEEAVNHQLLYMASVQSIIGHVCGGFLITEDWVVTAAHCDDNHPTHVVVGSHNVKKHPEKKIAIEKKCKHKLYQSVGFGNDIMLLRLSQKANISTDIGVIQIPVSDIYLKENQNCFVAGWGSTSSNGPSVQDLRVVNVSIINPEVCQSQWTGLPANVICAGGMETNKGFCQGDSGGPLVCGCTAVGVVSFNWYKNCSYPNKPNVYTDLSKYRQWIFNILKNDNC